jgi:hypothetical protein
LSLIIFPGSVSAKPLFVGKEGTFIIHDVGTSRIKRISKEVLFASVNDPRASLNNMYMSIEFDLVVKDTPNLIEPEGLTFIHLPHFNDKNVKAIQVQHLIRMYDQYKIVLGRISAKMDEANKKVEAIRLSASTKKRSEMTSSETIAEKRKWSQVDSVIDEITAFYHSETETFIEFVNAECRKVQDQDVYIRAEQAHADKKIKLKTFTEGAKGVFSVAGSIISVATGDLAEIRSLVGNTYDLILFFKNNYGRKAEDLYKDYMELLASLEALERSHDESRISECLVRVEAANNAYLNSLKRVDSSSFLDDTIEIQQRMIKVAELLVTVKNEGNIQDRQAVKKFTELKQQMRKLELIKENMDIAINEMQRPFLETNTLRNRKNTAVRDKETKLAALKNLRKSSNASDRVEGFISFIKEAIEITEEIKSTIDTIIEAAQGK